ncbi:MAG: PDZ domain-containing protein [Pirellulales bacterium]|nr:PDZ domain-containing protein [Pirellulales bacterium]
MPATEQTWRNQKVMHVVFGASALVMVISTLWMMASDHNREWKDWQLEDRKKEAWMTRARREKLSTQFAAEMEAFDGELQGIAIESIAEEHVTQFKNLVTSEDARLAEAGREEKAGNFAKLDAEFAAYGQYADAARVARGEINQVGAVVDQAMAGAAEKASGDTTHKRVDTVLKAALVTNRQAALAARKVLMGEFSRFVREAKRREKQLVGRRKFVSADRTAAVSEKGLKVGEGADQGVIEALQARIQSYSDQITELTGQIGFAKTYRMDLESIIGRIDAAKNKVTKQRQAISTELARLDDVASKNTWNVGEWVTRWPVLNALYDGNVRIDQIWLPDMTINYNFSQVARFDRCKSCHQAISQTAAGTATEPAYPTLPAHHRDLVIELATPGAPPELESASPEDLPAVYGLNLADEGVMDSADVTVHYVLPESAAAKAGLESGDVIRLAGDQPVYDRETVAEYLLNRSDWGRAASLSIRRGFDHPFTSHPRLDLYLTDSSPHPEKVVGCTICHDGQGSGTEFPWTSHTPDNAEQQLKWTREHGWFDNHHWIFPMKAARFAESNCLKCHFDKGALEASDRFPDTPAPKLVQGWTLVEKYGCFGCHEIGGFDGPDSRTGPDIRLAPNYSEVAQQILRDGGLSAQQRTVAETLVQTPGDDRARRELAVAILKDAELAKRGEAGATASLSAGTHELAVSLKDVEAPGSYRKVGPSLRFLGSKVDFDWLYSWIEEPANFRPSTRMPQFFNLHEHLLDSEDNDELETAKKFEPVEIRALTEFLLAASSDFSYLSPPETVTEKPSAERGKWQFESRGCLACHSHSSFPGIAADQGPDLSRISKKLDNTNGALWLYSWVKQPHRYHVRTKMPELFLDPIEEKDETGKPTGRFTDPAADITAFLLAAKTDWIVPNHEREWTPSQEKDLADLAQEWLTSDAIPSARAESFIHGNGIPSHLEPKLKADEKILIGLSNVNRTQRLSQYVARRTISKYGCFGCHDIPGFEDAKPIGTALAEWGRKDSSKLAFENMHKFLEGAGNPGLQAHVGGDDVHNAHVEHGHLDPADFDSDTSYYIQSLNSHSRDGFIWQKLRMPRSYDYKTTQNKGYNERLRMPKFPLSPEEREAIITFVLGLANEAPAEKYVYRPDARQQAIVEGAHVLEKFNCGGCHTLRMERWDIAYEEGQFDTPSTVVDFPFLGRSFSDKETAASKRTDARGLMHVSLHGQPLMSQETGLAQRVDDEATPLEADDDESDPYYRFKLWKDSLVDGQAWLVGMQDLLVPAARDRYGPAVGKAHPAWGGKLTRYLFPRVIAETQRTNPQAKGAEAWGWLPPPLMAEGEKVQTDWLHGFLMDPVPIRPAAIMRMPHFHMSTEDAAKLVNYFAAVSDSEFPYEYKSRQRASYLAEQESGYPDRMQEGMNIVVNPNYCVKCHAVEDFEPNGDPTTFGPNLADVHRRLRPEYLRKWVANPKRILPYTGMPVNIPYKPGASGIAEELFRGTSIEQLDGLVDLLMNFDTYARRQTPITPLVEESAANSDPNTSAATDAESSQR